jgi:hypothetical protein
MSALKATVPVGRSTVPPYRTIKLSSRKLPLESFTPLRVVAVEIMFDTDDPAVTVAPLLT